MTEVLYGNGDASDYRFCHACGRAMKRTQERNGFNRKTGEPESLDVLVCPDWTIMDDAQPVGTPHDRWLIVETPNYGYGLR